LFFLISAHKSLLLLPLDFTELRTLRSTFLLATATLEDAYEDDEEDNTNGGEFGDQETLSAYFALLPLPFFACRFGSKEESVRASAIAPHTMSLSSAITATRMSRASSAIGRVVSSSCSSSGGPRGCETSAMRTGGGRVGEDTCGGRVGGDGTCGG
jgi:hypothetical protein